MGPEGHLPRNLSTIVLAQTRLLLCVLHVDVEEP